MRGREHALQIAVAHMLQLVLDPECTWWSSIDHGVGKLGRAEAGIRKARGVKPGLPDIMILVTDPGARGCPYPLGIELKSDKGHSSPAQIAVAEAWSHMGERLEEHGEGRIYEARSLEEVHDLLVACHVPMQRRLTFFGGAHERPGRAAASRHLRPRGSRKSKNDVSLVFPDQAQKH